MAESASSLLSLLLREAEPFRHPRFREFLEMGDRAAQAVLLEASKPDSEASGFSLSFIASSIGLPAYGQLCDGLHSNNVRVASMSATALGLAGLQTAPIMVALGPRSRFELEQRSWWGMGGLFNAMFRDQTFSKLLREKLKRLGFEQLIPHSHTPEGMRRIRAHVGARRKETSIRMFETSREFDAWGIAALWIWRQRQRFELGTATEHGVIGKTGLPHRIEREGRDDEERTHRVKEWLLNAETLGDETFHRLRRDWQRFRSPQTLELYWAMGCLWALRQLSIESVKNAQDL